MHVLENVKKSQALLMMKKYGNNVLIFKYLHNHYINIVMINL